MLKHSARRAILGAVLVLLAVPAAANATISAAVTQDAGGVSVLGVVVTDPSSDVTVEPDVPGFIRVTATTPITSGANCAPAVATAVTCGPNGSLQRFEYTGGGGDDRLTLVAPDLATAGDGGPGDDTLSTVGGPDRLSGGPGADTLSAGGGNDVLDGGAGGDTLAGGDGNDSLIGGPGSDLLDAGPGDDDLDTADGEVDGASGAALDCGAGADRIFADNFLDVIDFVTCESVAPEFGPDGVRIVSGAAVQGSTLSAVANATGTPSIITFQWLRCGPDGALDTCVFIFGALSAAYTVTAADVGNTIRAGARADNVAGFDEAASAPTAVVTRPAAPAPVAPAIAPAPRPAAPALRPAPLSGRVTAVRCGGRTCRVTVAVVGPVTRARVDLRRGTRRLARLTRAVRGARVLRLTLRTRRPLARGTYTVAVRLSAADGRTRSFRRTVRVR